MNSWFYFQDKPRSPIYFLLIYSTTSSAGDNCATTLNQTSPTEGMAPRSTKPLPCMRKHHLLSTQSCPNVVLGHMHCRVCSSNICRASGCLTWQRTGLPNGASNWKGMCDQDIRDSSPAFPIPYWHGIMIAREYIQQGISLRLLRSRQLQPGKCVLYYF